MIAFLFFITALSRQRRRKVSCYDELVPPDIWEKVVANAKIFTKYNPKMLLKPEDRNLQHGKSVTLWYPKSQEPRTFLEHFLVELMKFHETHTGINPMNCIGAEYWVTSTKS